MDFDLMIDSVPKNLCGSRLTALPVTISLSMGFVFAMLAALLRRSKIPLLVVPIKAYVFVMRGTPLLVQIFLIYYGVGQFEIIRESIFWTVLKSPFGWAIIALTLNTTAYGSEITRGGPESVAFGEIEAGRAFRHVRHAAFSPGYFSDCHSAGAAGLWQWGDLNGQGHIAGKHHHHYGNDRHCQSDHGRELSAQGSIYRRRQLLPHLKFHHDALDPDHRMAASGSPAAA
jgi:His/Glu/Gln/Arg/opine family amino acid ABC transporter permease subunit